MRYAALLASIVCIFTVSSPCCAQAADWVTVRVKRGDTLSGLGKRHGVSVATLRRLNRRVIKTMLRPGMVLKIRKKSKRSTSKRTKKVRRPNPTTSRHAKKRSKSTTTHPKKNTRRRASSTTDTRRKRAKRSRQKKGQWLRYRTKRGDTMDRIAKRFKVRVKDLRSNNRRLKKVKSYRRLKRGLRLRIKRKSTHRLVGGVQLPRVGAGYTRMRPDRSWGTPCTIKLIQDVYAEFDSRNPGSVRGLIADISDEDGGWLPPHKSHQRGVDIDVSYYKRNNTPMRGLEVVTPESIDISKTWDLMRLFLNTGHIDMIFMDYRLQAVLYHYLRRQGYTEAQTSDWIQYPRSRRDRQGIIRHSPGHHHHLHIRFDCVKTSDPCWRPATALVPEAREKAQPRIVKSTDLKATPVQAIPGPLPAQTIETRHTTAQHNRQDPKRRSIATSAVLPAPPETPQRVLAKPSEPTPTADQQLKALFGSVTAPLTPQGTKQSLRPSTYGPAGHPVSTRQAIDKPERMTRLGATLL